MSWINKLLGAAALGIVALTGALTGAERAEAQDIPKEIKLDWAYYSPPALVIRKHGWMEEEFAPDGTTITWVFSQGSNNSLEFLNSGSSDFASTSGISALMARANGFPIKMVYILNTNEASMLMVPKDSTAQSLADLKGKKIAATTGTDPFFFLLRSLEAESIARNQIELVHLQHPDGLQALVNGSVSAWAGLDPHMAAGEINYGIKPLYRNALFSSYVPLSTHEAFIRNHPEALERVLKVYEKARLWILENPEETIAIVAEASGQSPEVIAQNFTRADFTKPVPAAQHIDTIRATIPLLKSEGIVRPSVDLEAALDALVDTSFIERIVN